MCVSKPISIYFCQILSKLKKFLQSVEEIEKTTHISANLQTLFLSETTEIKCLPSIFIF